MFFRSIRFKITILYMAILAVTVSSFSLVLYHNVRTGLGQNMDALLRSKAGGIARAVDTYWEASRLEAAGAPTPAPVPDAASNKRRNANFARIAQKWVTEESVDPALLNIIVRLFDTDGTIIASSKKAEGLVEMSQKSLLPVLQGKSRFDTLEPQGVSGMEMRVYTTPVFENDKVAYIVQVASPLVSIETALASLKITLFILFPVTVLATGLMGALLAKLTLRPVDNMIHTIRAISAQNMRLKIDVPATKDEIQKLAETFNEMIGRLERAFTAQRQLFEDLSHELKTPLTILKGEFEVALKKARTPAEYEETLKSALEETERITKLAENLLLLAKFDAREIRLLKKRIDLNKFLQKIVSTMKALAESNDVTIEFAAADGGVFLEGDEDQLKTAFLNIIDNALKYTPARGRVEVSLRKNGQNYETVISDTGPGIPKEELGRIFDRFYRSDKSRNTGGFGLGLSIARSIAEAHGGFISVSSRPSGGSAFTVTLPAA